MNMRTNTGQDLSEIWFKPFYQYKVDQHVNPHGVLVKNSEGVTSDEEVGWYQRQPDGSIKFLGKGNGQVGV